jgi:glucose-1-phosphate thymidylyltransferase
MKVVFLCGGVGKRMFPITEDKFLLDFTGKPLLEHQVELARKAGLQDFVIVGNPGNIQRIKQIAGAITGAKFEFVTQSQPLGIADALKSAAPILDSAVLIVNPNDVFDGTTYHALLDAYRSKSASSYIIGYEVRQYFPGGYLAVDEENGLTRIVEKPEPGTEPSNLVNILLHLHTDIHKLFEYIDIVRTTRDDVYECAMDGMVRHAYKIKVVRYNGFWAPIKYPWHIFDVVRCLGWKDRPVALHIGACHGGRQGDHRKKCAHTRKCRGAGAGLHRSQHGDRERRPGQGVQPYRSELRGRVLDRD